MKPEIALPTALAAVRVAGPALLVFIAFTLLFIKPTRNPKEPSPIVQVRVPVITPRRAVIYALLSLAALSYVADGTVVVLHAVLWHEWEGYDKQWKGIAEADIAGLVAFGGLLVIGTWKDAKGAPIWTCKRTKFFALVAVAFEIAQVALLSVALSKAKVPPPEPPHIPENPPPPGVKLAPFLHLGVGSFRLLLVLILVPVIYRPVKTFVSFHDQESSDTAVNIDESAGESSGLLQPGTANSQYGTFNPPPGSAARTPSIHSESPNATEAGIPERPTPIKEKVIEPSWGETFGRIRKLLPYLWPSKSIWLQFLAVLCMIILLVGRIVNPLLPWTLRALVNDLVNGTGFPLVTIFAYAGLRFLQGSGGLNALRDVIWAPVMQYSDREMSQLSFDHLLNLSLAFHTRRKTGEILRILDRGAAINHVFEMLLFNIIPTILDIVIALGLFFYLFGPILSGIIGLVMITYIFASVVLTRWRTKLRRAMNERDIITRGIHTDCLLNYDTVKYFSGEAHEGQRYREAIRQYQILEYKVIASLNLLNFVQNLIICLGLLGGSLIVAWRIVHATSSPADFVLFITYLVQLYGPLNMLGSIYRSVNQNLVDTEKLLNLLNEPTEVNDKPGAPDLVVTDGVITFENVNFSYDDRSTAIHDVTFTVPKGNSVALVGESGAGKSTILRLLFRQYDLKDGQGRILIDGQDIRDVTQASLRRAIGVVPQDSVLFNDTVAYNIGYGKFGASQAEIEHAAMAAQMHERIIAFPDGYQTKVGERGVRLSGGEKQRVSIARTFLKNSPILALDEATSALDTATEKDIQKALQNLLANRTSISIAHRLSTIASADIILVLKDGRIVESGNLDDLVSQKGVFAAMWEKQISADQSHVGHGFQFSKESSKGYDITHDIMASEATVVPAINTSDDKKAKEMDISSPIGDSLSPQMKDTSAKAASISPSAVDPASQYSAVVAGDAPALSPPTIDLGPSQTVAFPTSDDSSSQRASAAQTPSSIKFKDEENGEGKSGDPNKRFRIASQNIQRLARRISTVGRKPSSSGSIGNAQQLERQGSVDLGEGSGTTPIGALGTQNDAAQASTGAAGSDAESASGSQRKMRFLRKKPTKSNTGF